MHVAKQWSPDELPGGDSVDLATACAQGSERAIREGQRRLEPSPRYAPSVEELGQQAAALATYLAARPVAHDPALTEEPTPTYFVPEHREVVVAAESMPDIEYDAWPE